MRHKVYEVKVAGHTRQFRLNPTDATRLGATPVKSQVIAPDNPPTAKKKAKE